MRPSITIFLLILIWILSFVEPSGWAMSLHLPDKVNIAILILSVFFYISAPRNRQRLSPYLIAALLITFIYIPLTQHDSWQGASYLTAFLTVYIVSQGEITRKVIRQSALAIAAGGLIVLLIYSRGTMLSGWNDNAIAMVGLFSFLYFSIFLIQQKGTGKFWAWNIVTLLYLLLLFGTDCRSGMLFSAISVLGIIYQNKTRRLFARRWFNIVLLNIPLLVALLVIYIAGTSMYNELNHWSQTEFHKDIFNQRDLLWDISMKLLERTDYIGTGKFLLNYHNSGIAALSVFGIAGYIVWILYFNSTLSQLRRYLTDEIVLGSFFAFTLIFLQQTVDLGFISPYPNLLPYMILGVGLGRIRLLQNSGCHYLSR